MKIGILGTGNAGHALAEGFLTLGHQVMLGSRSGQHERIRRWGSSFYGRPRQGGLHEAADFGDVVVLATFGSATPQLLRDIGCSPFAGKIVLDVTNPLEFHDERPPRLLGAPGSSGDETHQMLLPDAFVVKVFNTVGYKLFFRPEFYGDVPDMFLCGNNTQARQMARTICRDFGWGVVEVGDITAAHYLEAMALVWLLSASESGVNRQAFKMLDA